MAGGVTTDTPSAVADFYITKLTGAGWEKVEQTVLGGPDLGQQLFFTRQQDNQRQVVEMVILSKTGLAANPQTKAAASNLPDGASLILTVPEQA